MNPHETSDGDSIIETPRQIIGIDSMTVQEVQSHTTGDDVSHHVKVKPDMFDSTQVATVATGLHGDVIIPEEGDRVLVAYRADGRPVVIGSQYPRSMSIPEFEPGERRVGHPASDSFIQLFADGTVRIESDSGAVVKMDANGQIALADDGGNGIEAQNNGEIHIYGKVKQHTSQTLDL